MPRHAFLLRSLSAALVLSTTFTAPVLAVDATYGSGPLTGPVDLGPIDVFHSSASLTSTSYGFAFSGDLGNGTLAGGSSISANNEAFYVNGDVTGTLTNSGTLESAMEDGIVVDGEVLSFINTRTGVVRTERKAIDFDGEVGSFLNEGMIESDYRAIDFDSHVRSFTNTGTIANIDSGQAIDAWSFGSFTNWGSITSVGSGGVFVSDDVGSFTNESTGVIESGNNAVSLGGNVGAFTNRGRIASTHFIGAGVDIQGDAGAFNNTGTISTTEGKGVYIAGSVTGSFINGLGGRISGAYEEGVLIDGSVASFINNGTISSIGGSAAAVRIGQPITGTFINNGTIESNAGWGVGMRAGRLINTGTIRGVTAINSDGPTATFLVNSGTIEGTGGYAFYFGDNTEDDTAQLLTGSRIFGIMDFSHGNDTLDVAGFRGNAVLNVAHLENVVTGSALVSQQLDGDGTGTVSVVDATGITSGGSAVMGEIAGAIGSEIAGALGGMTGSAPAPEPMGYAPARPVGAAEAATDELVAAQQPTGPQVWGKVFGGVTGKANEYGAALGGIVAGSHVSVDASTRLGGVVSVSGSRFATVGNGQVVASTIGALGLYGSTDLGGPVLSYSVLGGVATNHSDRTVTAMVTETARADFASWFWSPELGLSIPVPLLDGAETSAGFKLRYIGGGVGAYTETGSSQNLSVGSSSLNLLDARAELTSKAVVAGNDFGDVTLSATGGLLALHNFGSSVTIAGFPLATTAASFAYGVYGDVTLQAPVGPSATASASAGAELRSDGVATASANMGLSATF